MTEHDTTFPQVYEAMLDDEGLDALFCDLGLLDSELEVRTKGAPLVRSDEGASDLSRARAALAAGSAQGVQIRYVHQGVGWCDTLIRLPVAVRLVRTMIALCVALACLPSDARAEPRADEAVAAEEATVDLATTASPPAEPHDPPGTFRAGEVLFHPRLQVRMRAEERVNPYASAAPLDDELHFVTARFRAGISADYRDLRVVLEVQDARNFGTAAPGTDPGSSFGVHQAYGEVRHGGSYLRLGRQEIAYGDERLVGPLDWASAARAFDAVRGHYQHGIVGLDLSAALVAQQSAIVDPGPPPSTRRSGGDYFGAAQLSVAAFPALSIELLYLYRRDRPDAASPTRDRRISAGSLRVSSTQVHGFRYVAEAISEWGEVAGARFVGYGAVADVFYATPTRNVATVSAGFALGSGERNGRVGEFENFFPTNHKFYGFADLFGLRNLVEGHATVVQRIGTRPITVFASAHSFYLERAGASWRNAVGALVAPGAAGGSRHVGEELDLGWNATFREWLGFSGGYSYFAPGSAAARLGRDEANHWLWLMVDFRTP